MNARVFAMGGVMAMTVGITGLAFADGTTEAPAAPAAEPAKPSAAVAVVPAPAPAPVPVAAAAPVAPTPAPAAAPAPAALRTITEPALPLRAPQPLELAKPTPSTSSWGTRLGLVALAGLGVFVYLRKKRGQGLVEVAGMRLLGGVTPSTIQTLAVLPDEAGEAAELAAGMRDEDAPEPPVAVAPSDPARLRAPLAAQLEGPSLADRARALFEGPDKRIAQAALSIASAAKYASRSQDLTRAPEDEDEEAPAPKPAARRARAASAARETREEVVEKAALPSRTTRASLPPARSSRPPVEGQARGLLLALGAKK